MDGLDERERAKKETAVYLNTKMLSCAQKEFASDAAGKAISVGDHRVVQW